MRPPVAESVISAAERALGASLPADYRAWLAHCEGFTTHGPLPCVLHGIAVASEERASFIELSEPRWASLSWKSSWLPVVQDARDLFRCIDLDTGHIVRVDWGRPERPVVAKDFTALLAEELDRLRTHQSVVAEWAGFYFRVMRREDVRDHLHVRGEPPPSHVTVYVEAGILVRQLVDTGLVRFAEDAYVPRTLEGVGNCLCGLTLEDSDVAFIVEFLKRDAVHAAVTAPLVRALLEDRRSREGMPAA